MDPDIAQRVLVVIPTLNEQEHIETVLRALIADDPIAALCPVIVADGGSQDATCDIVTRLQDRFPNLHLLHNPGRTQAAALNMMLDPAYQDYDILIRCDAHAAYSTHFVSRLVEAMREQHADSVVIPMDAMADAGCFQQGLAWVADTKLGAGGSPHRGGAKSGYVDHGHHAAFLMRTFRKLGGYDVNFIANEDAEYDRRVIASGGKIWLEAAIRIGYFPRQSARALWKQYFRYGAGRAQTCVKHKIMPALRQLIPAAHTALLLLSLVLLPFTGLALIWPVFYALLCAGLSLSVAAKHRSVCGLIAGPAVAIMHTAWGLGFISSLISQRLARARKPKAD